MPHARQRLRAITIAATLGFAGAALSDSGPYQTVGWDYNSQLSSPLYPRDHLECSKFEARAAKVVQAIFDAHDQCMADPAHAGEPKGHTTIFSIPDRQAPDCDRISCQRLHDARDEADLLAKRQIQLCNDRVTKYLAEKKARDDAKAKAVAAAEARSPCAVRRRHYAAICSGGQASEADFQTCQREKHEIASECSH